MFTFPSDEELGQLQAFGKPFALSIYAPMAQNDAASASRIDLKNLLKQAKVALESAGASKSLVRRILQTVENRSNDRAIWAPPPKGGMAIFAHNKLFRHFHIPSKYTPHMISVSIGFNLEPLLAAMQDDRPYYLLTLSHNNVQLLEGSHYHLEPVDLKDFPANMKQALQIDEYPNETETHSVAPASRADHSEASHGQYNKRQTDKIMLEKFFRRIDRRLRALLQRKQTPLIIGGVNYLLPIYRRANTYPNLLPQTIPGNLEQADLNNLRKQAWSIVNRVSSP